MYEALYVEVNFISFLILAIIMVKMKRGFDKQARNVAFSRVVLATMGVLLLDIVWVFVEKGKGGSFRIVNYVVNGVYLTLGSLVSCLWFFYVERTLNPQNRFPKWAYCAILLPFAALLALCAASYWTGWVFYVDANNIYHRGSLHLVSVLVTYSYMIAASVRTLVHIHRTKYRQRRAELALLLSFAVLPALGGIINALSYGIPSLWPAAALSLLLLFIEFQTAQISTDGLTGLNNRRQFDKYFYSLSSLEAKHGDGFFLFMMDIDSFKRINDSHGHLCGDEALAQAAVLLKEACRDRNAFLARYGGDEFVIVDPCKSMEDAEAFKAKIAAAFEGYNAHSGRPYRLTLSIGYSQRAPDSGVCASELIAQADSALYREKERHKRLTG